MRTVTKRHRGRGRRAAGHRAWAAVARWTAGLLWLAAWVVALHGLALPWSDLGGVVHERLRWLHRFVLLVGPLVGFTAAHLARQPSAARVETRPAWPALPDGESGVAVDLYGSGHEGEPPDGDARQALGHVDVRIEPALSRAVVYPSLALTAAGLAVLTGPGWRDLANVWLTGVLACWAGFDVARGALPLMRGALPRHYNERHRAPRGPFV